MILRRSALLLVLASVMAAALPHAAERLSQVPRLLLVPRAEQRGALNAPWVQDLAAIRPRLSAANDVFFVAATEHDIGAAALASAELFPLPTHLYVGTEDFIDATVRGDLQPRSIVWANQASGRSLRLASFSDVSGSGLSGALRERIEQQPASRISGSFVIPLVVSATGTAVDVYRTSLLVENDSPKNSKVELTFHSESGAAVVRRFELERGERLRVWDAARELFGKTSVSSWVEARSSAPIRIAASLVNSGRTQVDEVRALRPACGKISLSATVHDASASKLWLVNTSARPATVDWHDGNERSVMLEAQTSTSISGSACASSGACKVTLRATPDCTVVAFFSEKDAATGATAFVWPETESP